jgi:ribosome maturation factor RimP
LRARPLGTVSIGLGHLPGRLTIEAMSEAKHTGETVLEKVEALLAPAIEALGYAIVRITFVKGTRATLQIMAERIDEQAMAIEDCTAISRAASAILEVDDPIQGEYNLEVSSPGIDRPLVRAKDYERFAGFVAKVETDRLIEGRKRFMGRLIGLGEDGLVRLKDEAQEFAVPFEAIAKAKLVLTDDLIANSPDRPRV